MRDDRTVGQVGLVGVRQTLAVPITVEAGVAVSESSAVWAISGVCMFESSVPWSVMKFLSAGICSRSESTFGLSRL